MLGSQAADNSKVQYYLFFIHLLLQLLSRKASNKISDHARDLHQHHRRLYLKYLTKHRKLKMTSLLWSILKEQLTLRLNILKVLWTIPYLIQSQRSYSQWHLLRGTSTALRLPRLT